MSTAVNTVKQASRSVITLLGSKNALQNNLPITPSYDTETTLNSFYNVFPTLTPTAGSKAVEQYFGIGIGGDYFSGTDNILNPQEVSATNMNLYKQIPFRAVPLEEDISGAEQAMYRIRSVQNVNGRQMVLYYLKKIVLADAQVQFVKFDPTTQSDQPYTLDPSQLTPKPPTTPVDGATTNTTEEITAAVSGTLPILGTEIVEVINALYNGDMRLARISELGIYTGVDQQLKGTDSKGNSFSYTEAVFTQLAQQHTFLGRPFNDAGTTYTPSFKFTSGNMCISQNDLVSNT